MSLADWELAKSQLDALIALARRLGDEHLLIFGLAFRLILPSVRQMR